MKNVYINILKNTVTLQVILTQTMVLLFVDILNNIFSFDNNILPRHLSSEAQIAFWTCINIKYIRSDNIKLLTKYKQYLD